MSGVSLKKSVEAREVIAVAAEGISLLGTYHRPQVQTSAPPASLKDQNRIGLLFLNGGFLPRAGSGDAAVYWADSLAKSGYPSFRIDLPGLGDSDGDIPISMLDFVHSVNDGRYSRCVSSAVKDLIQRFQLPGVALVGHCAGAISAIYTAAVSPAVKGLVLLDPYFHQQNDSTNLKKGLHLLVTRNRLLGYMSELYDRWKYLNLRVRGNKLPRNANLPLIHCWQQLASARLPVLVLNAPKPRPRAGEFNYFRYLELISDRNHRMAVKRVEGTDHSFAKGPGKEIVRQHIEEWLSTHFPITSSPACVGPNDRRSGTAELPRQTAEPSTRSTVGA